MRAWIQVDCPACESDPVSFRVLIRPTAPRHLSENIFLSLYVHVYLAEVATEHRRRRSRRDSPLQLVRPRHRHRMRLPINPRHLPRSIKQTRRVRGDRLALPTRLGVESEPMRRKTRPKPGRFGRFPVPRGEPTPHLQSFFIRQSFLNKSALKYVFFRSGLAPPNHGWVGRHPARMRSLIC